MQATKLVLKPDPVLTPVPAVGNQLELLLAKRMVRMCYSQTSSPCGAVDHSSSSVPGKAFCCDSRYVAFAQITGIARKRHRSTRVFGSNVLQDNCRSREQVARFQDLLQQPSHTYLIERANAGYARVATRRKPPLVSMAATLSGPISDTSGCL